jgi:hypothetical protein
VAEPPADDLTGRKLRHAALRRQRRERLTASLPTTWPLVFDADVRNDYPDDPARDRAEDIRCFIEGTKREAARRGLSVDRLVKLLRASVTAQRGKTPLSLRDQAPTILREYDALLETDKPSREAVKEIAAHYRAVGYRVSTRTIYNLVRLARRSVRSR